jgi:hypothetical protein
VDNPYGTLPNIVANCNPAKSTEWLRAYQPTADERSAEYKKIEK